MNLHKISQSSNETHATGVFRSLNNWCPVLEIIRAIMYNRSLCFDQLKICIAIIQKFPLRRRHWHLSSLRAEICEIVGNQSKDDISRRCQYRLSMYAAREIPSLLSEEFI